MRRFFQRGKTGNTGCDAPPAHPNSCTLNPEPDGKMATVIGDKMSDAEYREKLIRTVKKEVKQIMEEAVTRKFVHEDSGHIIALCAAVEACLLHGLKKRTISFLSGNTAAALINKVGKDFQPAADLAKKCQEIELENEKKRLANLGITNIGNEILKRQNSFTGSAQAQNKYLWSRMALYNKVLARIVEYLTENSSKYYESNALLADPVEGTILASLLVGPCALDFSKVKTPDHYWTDPTADELVQRHRIPNQANLNGPPSPNRRPHLKIIRMGSGGPDDFANRLPVSPRDYVESLHQNSRTTLLYGKNNVLVQPKEDMEPVPGYLSLHQTADNLTIKWTPNQLMNGSIDSNEGDADRSEQNFPVRKHDGVIYWDYAVNINLDEVVYLHCHQQPDSGGTIVLVGQDGVQRPPIHFPKGGHLLAFLSCLENGLLPHGQLDPPLWSQRGKGKVFPRLRRRGAASTRQVTIHKADSKEGEAVESIAEEEATDYVFRILTAYKPEVSIDLMDPKFTRPLSWSSKPLVRRTSSGGSQTSPPYQPTTAQVYAPRRQSTDSEGLNSTGSPSSDEPSVFTRQSSLDSDPGDFLNISARLRTSLKLLCDTMKKQIISRAFYGWLAHCRHLRTVRTHLSGLVHHKIVSQDRPMDATFGLTGDMWWSMHEDGQVNDEEEIYRLVYFGGCDHEIRAEVWPYLLGHYTFGDTDGQRREKDDLAHTQYENIMSDWMAVEAIIRQRDREAQAASIAKLSSGSSIDSQAYKLYSQDSTISNDHSSSIDSLVDEDEILQKSGVYYNISGNVVLVFEDDEGNHETSRARKKDSVDSSSESPEFLQGINHTVELPKGLSVGSGQDRIDEGIGSSCSTYDRDSVDYAGRMSVNDKDPGDENENRKIKRSHEMINIDRQATVDEEDEEDQRDQEISACMNEQETLAVEPMDRNPSPESTQGCDYDTKLLDSYGLNLHRIDKDVARCDRNYPYFTTINLEKLRNIMCTYVWEHMEVGYVQGMCDLAAPLLVILDDEAKTYSCFCQLMKRMSQNFPHGGAMDTHFANMRSLIQILDSEMFELMHQNGDYTHFYFCYRWFLLDFKRELLYEDVFSVWETIWTARPLASEHFVLFIALALVEYYRDIILDNSMDFTDIIKFFNEMAERHDAKAVLKRARELVFELQSLIENK
ncbi:small G protein signaling modulator 2-like isoform X10 [Branchiostoma floridae]|uniref:Small G protein signaling modulator 2-like isoform X10 n=1 Tax=Branchiostoma floridae TaxID=7739 RepID=A0A9J7LY79_BRAFL|nr:small G protein signaling modulator 2-like isoform X10 [Branchiostoma floridae]